MSRSDWDSEPEAASQAAQQAGQILLDWAGRFSIQRKAVNDLVTEADHAAQAAIQKRLQRQFPNDAFLGEESPPATPSTRGQARRWIVDPLDGTTNYVHGLPFYCVSIGLEANSELVVGIVYDPIRKECFTAAKGRGAKRNGVPIHVSDTSVLRDGLVGVGLPTDMTANSVPGAIMLRQSTETRAMRRLGSAALALAYVAAGRLDAFWGHTLNPWDSAGGAVLVREAGGRATNHNGRDYSADDPDLLASNGLLHSPLLESLANK
jgi:myo-inositol-1(or 4)-monophosphatase